MKRTVMCKNEIPTKTIVMNRFYQMDCMAYMNLLPDNSVDCIVCDPPYGVDINGNKYFDDRLATVKANIDGWFSEMARVLKPHCHIYIYVPTIHMDIFISALKKYFNYNNCLPARAKTGTKVIKGHYKHDVQFIAYGSKGCPRELTKVNVQPKSKAWIDDKRNTDTNPFTYNYSSFLDTRANAEIKNHSNAKNVDQIEGFLLLSTNVGDVVLDPFAGGCSTARAARAIGRNYYTCDLVDYGALEDKEIA